MVKIQMLFNLSEKQSPQAKPLLQESTKKQCLESITAGSAWGNTNKQHGVAQIVFRKVHN